MSKQYYTIEEEIEKLVEKSMGDLKSRIFKAVSRHEKKVLKEQATQFKAATASTKSRTKNVSNTSGNNRRNRSLKYSSEDDYSE